MKKTKKEFLDGLIRVVDLHVALHAANNIPYDLPGRNTLVTEMALTLQVAQDLFVLKYGPK